MKVKELIERLEDMDPEANVLVMSQQSWPFENDLRGICAREDCVENSDADEAYSDGRASSDVFLVEGGQLRYGNKTAWEVC